MANSKQNSLGWYVVAIVGAFVVVAVLVNAMKTYTAPPPVNQARIQERQKALTEVRGVAQAESETYAKIDAAKGLYRLKISQAVALTEQRYKNPSTARTDLISRAEKANFVPPPTTFE